MQVRRWLAGALGLVLAALALAPASVSAAQAPVLSSMTPNEIGSNGGQKVFLHGEHFAPTSVVVYAELRLKVKATGTAAKDESRDISATEIEMDPPFKEHGRRLVKVCNTEPPPEACSSETLEPAHNQMTIWNEVYRNEVAIGTGRVPTTGLGEILLNSPQINTQIECENVGFGSSWNEAPTERTGPLSGHGEILVWWASGHTPKSTHTELNSRCRFVYHGTEENQPTSPIAWATAEPPLNEVMQEGIVCTEAIHKELTLCPNEAERSQINVISEVSREGLSLPWYIDFTEKSERLRAQIGLREVCKEHTELLESCPERSEREPLRGEPEACNVPPTPAPPGCVKVDIVSNPPLNIHMEYEGHLEPQVINSGPNGLSPSSWEFEGSAAGEPALHWRETTTTEGSVTGNLKINGFSGQELITVR